MTPSSHLALVDPDLLHQFLHSLAYWMGLTSPESPTYLFWSGIGSDLQRFVLLYLGYKVFKGIITEGPSKKWPK